MTKKVELFSGRVLKVTGEDLSPNRNKWLRLAEAEPDLGTAPIDGSFLIGNTNNARQWTTDLFVYNDNDPITGTNTFTLSLHGNLQVEGNIDVIGNINGTITVDIEPAAINLPDGAVIRIGPDQVLSQTTLGEGVVNSSLESVGTITTGVWEATPISPAYGGTGISNPDGVTPNTVLYGNGLDPMLETNVGTAGQVLQINTTNGNPIFDIIDGGGWGV